MEELHWKLRGLCVNKWHLFDSIEDEYGKDYYPHLTEARGLCEQCPVFDTCKRESKGERGAIWAGEPR